MEKSDGFSQTILLIKLLADGNISNLMRLN